MALICGRGKTQGYSTLLTIFFSLPKSLRGHPANVFSLGRLSASSSDTCQLLAFPYNPHRRIFSPPAEFFRQTLSLLYWYTLRLDVQIVNYFSTFEGRLRDICRAITTFLVSGAGSCSSRSFLLIMKDLTPLTKTSEDAPPGATPTTWP